MTGTTKPNNDRDRFCDRDAARNPRRHAMGAPEGTASSGSTSPPLDMVLLRTLADEVGYWPAITDEVDIERHRRLNAAPDHGPQVETWAERHRMMGHHPHPAPTDGNPERWDCERGYFWRILTGEQIRMNTMNAERGWIGDPQPTAEQRRHSVEVWAERHRLEGHHPHPAPTKENPERWECMYDPDAKWTAVWRILTAEQVRRKFAHVNHRMRTP